MTDVSISAPDQAAGSPREGDKIARNPANHEDRWLVSAAYFAANFVPAEVERWKANAKKERACSLVIEGENERLRAIEQAAREARRLVDRQTEDHDLWLLNAARGQVNFTYVQAALRLLHDAVEQIPLAALDQAEDQP
jgi:hypothetical protein